MKDKLIFNDQTEIELEPGAGLHDLKVLSASKQDMLAAWERFTEANLKSVQIKNSDGTIIGNYEDLVLENETSKVLPDGTISTSFHLREKSDLELLQERVTVVEKNEKVHDGAIADLGEVVSGLAEEGGLL